MLSQIHPTTTERPATYPLKSSGVIHADDATDEDDEGLSGFFSMPKFHEAYLKWKLDKGLIDRETYLSQSLAVSAQPRMSDGGPATPDKRTSANEDDYELGDILLESIQDLTKDFEDGLPPLSRASFVASPSTQAPTQAPQPPQSNSYDEIEFYQEEIRGQEESIVLLIFQRILDIVAAKKDTEQGTF